MSININITLGGDAGSPELDDAVLDNTQERPKGEQSYRLPPTPVTHGGTPEVKYPEQEKIIVRDEVDRKTERMIIEEADDLKRDIASSDIKKLSSVFRESLKKVAECSKSHPEKEKKAEMIKYTIENKSDRRERKLKDIIRGDN